MVGGCCCLPVLFLWQLLLLVVSGAETTHQDKKKKEEKGIKGSEIAFLPLFSQFCSNFLQLIYCLLSREKISF